MNPVNFIFAQWMQWSGSDQRKWRNQLTFGNCYKTCDWKYQLKVRLLEKTEVHQRSIISFTVLISYLWYYAWKKELARWTKRYSIKINTENCLLHKAIWKVVQRKLQKTFKKWVGKQSKLPIGSCGTRLRKFNERPKLTGYREDVHVAGKTAGSKKSQWLLLTVTEPHTLSGQRVLSQKQCKPACKQEGQCRKAQLALRAALPRTYTLL